MIRNLLMMVAAPLWVVACADPFQLVEPRPDYRRTPPPRPQPQPMPQPGFQPGPDDTRWGDVTPQGGQSQGSGWNAGPAPVTERFPVAQRTEIPGRVISPHPPYNVIDVSEFQSGQLAIDPISNEIFRVP